MTHITPLSFHCRIILFFVIVLAVALPSPSSAISIVSESFENGALDSHIAMTTVGGYSSSPGLQSVTDFGSAHAFGFGRSDCPFSCFDAHVTGLTISFGAPIFISTLAFKEMEKFGNWGSGGAIFVDGVLFGTTHYDYGRLPYNDLTADPTFRSQTFNLNRTAQTIELRVRDITNQSEIFIDDLRINGSPATTVPEADSGVLLLMGLIILWLGRSLQSNAFQNCLMKQLDETR